MQIINLEPAQGFVPYDKAAAQPYLVTLAAALSLLRRLISAAASDACAMDLVKSFPAAQGAAGNKAAVCIKCPEGKGVAMGAGTQESDCKWSKLIIDFPYLSLDISVVSSPQ